MNNRHNFDPEDLDWRYIDSALERMHPEIPRKVISYYRRKLGLPKGTLGRKPVTGKSSSYRQAVDDANLDWTLSDAELHRRHPELPYWVIREERLKLGLPKGDGGDRRYAVETYDGRRKIDPAELDWSRIDAELAREHGVTRERIRQLRKEVCLPSSRSIPRGSALKLDSVDWSQPNRVIAGQLGVTEGCISVLRKKHRKPGAPRKQISRKVLSVDWPKMDWRKPVSQIARETGVTVVTVYAIKSVFAPKKGQRVSQKAVRTYSKLRNICAT